MARTPDHPFMLRFSSGGEVVGQRFTLEASHIGQIPHGFTKDISICTKVWHMAAKDVKLIGKTWEWYYFLMNQSALAHTLESWLNTAKNNVWSSFKSLQTDFHVVQKWMETNCYPEQGGKKIIQNFKTAQQCSAKNVQGWRIFCIHGVTWRKARPLWHITEQRCVGKVLIKQGFRTSCFGAAAWPMIGLLPVGHICRPDRHSCSVCLPQHECSLSPNTTWLTGGGFAVKCKKLGADWACLHEVFDVSAIPTWVECLFTHSYTTLHVHTDAVCL